LRVELIEDDARLDACPSFRDVHLEHGPQVLRGVDDDPWTDGLAGLRGAATAHRDRASILCADADQPNEIVARLRQDDTEWFDLIDARVGRIQRTRDAIESNLAFDVGGERALEAGDVDMADIGAGQRRQIHLRDGHSALSP
jgi:hypothetical protein